MKKKILIASAIIFIILIMSMIGWSLYVEIDTTYKGLEFVIPIFCKNDVTKLSYKNLFDEKKLEKCTHSIDEVINTMYYAVSFGVFDVDNNILYYYQFDR